MEVELFERVRAIANLEGVAFREIKLDSVAVVDDGVWPLAAVDLERWLPRTDTASDVDW